ncbi:hypothetical protein M8818_004151 [Zalaria obscura]|uniref:Uncharacterized protein n=1 Tax=Zalaria obscura TaxID=2024903 RepID=A0ACC3SE85_9PEZI
MLQLLTITLSLLTLLTTTTLALPTPSKSNSKVTTNTFVLNGLPAPTGTLKYIALGYGTQNYSCAALNDAPVSIGALATLYDATSILSHGAIGAASIPKMPALALSMGSGLGLPTLGHHFFSAAGVPTFSLEAAKPAALLSAKKVADVVAPTNSAPNSVDWLFLTDDGRGVSKHLNAVYRVETAGGKPPGVCSSVGTVTEQYAAEYWFYD